METRKSISESKLVSLEAKQREREKEEDLKAAAGVGGGGVVDHLENEGSASPHLDFTDVEAEP